MDKKIITDMHELSKSCVALADCDFKTGVVADIAKDLLDTVNGCRQGLLGRRPKGLAANQIGIHRCACLVRDGNSYRLLVNPEIVEGSCRKKVTKYEVCLSYKRRAFQVERYCHIQLKYIDKDGNRQVKKFHGKLARRIQHEIDHLNGVVPTDEQFAAGSAYAKKIPCAALLGIRY